MYLRISFHNGPHPYSTSLRRLKSSSKDGTSIRTAVSRNSLQDLPPAPSASRSLARAFVVLRLITSSNLVGSNWRSAGLAPFKILPTKPPRVGRPHADRRRNSLAR